MPVEPDLSQPPPIYRPLGTPPHILINLLKLIIAPAGCGKGNAEFANSILLYANRLALAVYGRGDPCGRPEGWGTVAQEGLR